MLIMTEKFLHTSHRMDFFLGQYFTASIGTGFYLGLHKLGVVLVDLHLFDLLLSVLCVQ